MASSASPPSDVASSEGNLTLLTNHIDSWEDDSHDYQKVELNLTYAICEAVVATLAVVGNALVILVFRKERRLRRRTNYYIVSLAAADFLVGLLGIPFAVMSSVGLPTNLYACLFTVSLLVVLCTISIFCLVAVSVDRYWAILHPMGYSRNVRTKTALIIISICWFAGTLIGFLPLMGWHKGPAENGRCFFLGVMDYNYLLFLYFGTIITPALLLAGFYAHIYHVILRQLRQIVTINPYNGGSSTSSMGSGRPGSSGTMLRVLGAAQKREVKATQNLSIIVLFFMICWIPLYTINCVFAFCRDCKVNSTFVLSCIILSHLNSAGNPLLYAYHLKDFRAALKAFICGLLGIRVQQPPPPASSNNLANHRLQLRDPPMPISSLLGTTMALAAVTASADAARDIWRISEISDEQQRQNFSSSNDDVFLPPPPSLPNDAEERQLSGFMRSEPYTLQSDARDGNETGPAVGSSLAVSGDFIHSPAKSLKLSPFKAVVSGIRKSQSKMPRSCSLSEEGDGVRHRVNNGFLPENHSCN